MYDIGDRVELQALFTNNADAPANPTAVVCKLKDPGGTVETLTLTASGTPTGTWKAQATLDTSGLWWYRFEGTGAVVAAGEASLRVRGTSFS